MNYCFVASVVVEDERSFPFLLLAKVRFIKLTKRNFINHKEMEEANEINVRIAWSSL